MTARLAIVLLVVLATALAASPAAAHVGGKAQPRIAASVSEGDGLAQTLTVRLTDADGGTPVSGATVEAAAEMTSPHVMRTVPWALPEVEPGVYRARVRFLMPASWVVRIDVTGEDVVPASAELRVDIVDEEPAGAAGAAQPGEPTPPSTGQTPSPPAEATPLPTTVEDAVSGRDAASIALLWLHATVAVAWMIGVIVMVLALGTAPGPLAESWRARLAAWYRSWGAWLHWGLVPAIVLTGVYNMLWVTPFPLAWTPDEVRALGDIPYGPLYEAILVVKLGLFAALLVTGTQVLRRTIRPVAQDAAARGFLRTLAAGLGAPGIVYLLAVPLILGAAAALRYVHILSHVAEVLQAGGAP